MTQNCDLNKQADIIKGEKTYLCQSSIKRQGVQAIGGRSLGKVVLEYQKSDWSGELIVFCAGIFSATKALLASVCPMCPPWS